MEVSFSELKEKEIVNVFDGKRFGRIIDIVFDSASGAVRGVVLPGDKKLFKKNDNYFVPLERLRKIGDDVILVNLQTRDYDGGGLISASSRKRTNNSYGTTNFKYPQKMSDGEIRENTYNQINCSRNYNETNSPHSSFVRFKRVDNKKYK